MRQSSRLQAFLLTSKYSDVGISTSKIVFSVIKLVFKEALDAGGDLFSVDVCKRSSENPNTVQFVENVAGSASVSSEGDDLEEKR